MDPPSVKKDVEICDEKSKESSDKPAETLPSDSEPKKKRSKRGRGGKFTHRKRGGKHYKASQKNLSETVTTFEAPDDTRSHSIDTCPENSTLSNSTEYRVQEPSSSSFKETSGSADFTEETVSSLIGVHMTPDCSDSETSTEKTKDDYKPDILLVEEVLLEVQKRLPFPFSCFQEQTGINIFLLSRDTERISQRRAFFSFGGSADITVHCEPVSKGLSSDIIKPSEESVLLTWETKHAFVDWILNVISRLRKYEVCVGVEDVQFKPLWEIDRNGYVDKNPYHELRYSETFRSHACHRLLSVEKIMKRRCPECIRVKTNFGVKIQHHLSADAQSNTPNVHLNRSQLIGKVERQQKQLHYARSQIVKLKAALEKSLCIDGIDVDDELSNDLCKIFEGTKLTPIQELFVQEQIRLAKAKSASGHRWHPTIIRFALLLKTTSSAAYKAIQDSGVITLPSERTLFEYSHVTPAEEGCTNEKLDRVCQLIAAKYPETYQQWHVLEMDEMHINKKLVVKSTGRMIGYCSLSDAEEELRQLEAELTGEKIPDTPPLASKILAFLVKGVATSVAEVVASYPTSDSNDSEWLSDKAWGVIGALERSGLKVIGVVGDGAAVNRSFFYSHIPITKLDSKVVFDTRNLCAKNHDRPLYFFSDVPHLLKTLRNCIYHSGSGSHYSKLLTKNNQVIVWNTIKRLYEEDKQNNLRRCHKLNSYNVKLDSHSVMKVNYAADVICMETALDLESRNWPGTKELVQLLKHGANFYDMLRGSYSTQGVRKANPSLYPYESVDDDRFDKLMEILHYFKNWEAEVRGKKNLKQGEQSKMLISQQTLDGIEMTIRSFIAATRFLLKEGVKFINPKVFNQDPLEKYFGKQRQSGGGNRNPTVAQFCANEVKIGIHKDLNVRGSNVGGKKRSMEITEEKLPKRLRSDD